MHQRLWLNMKRYSILKKKKKVKYSSTMRIAKKDWNTKKLMKIAWKRQTKIKGIHEGMQKKYLQK